MKLGVCESNLGGPLEENLAWAKAQGLQGVQIWLQKMESRHLSPGDVVAAVREHGLEITAMGGGPKLSDPAEADVSVARFRQIIDAGQAMGVSIVTAETKEKPAGLTEAEAWEATTRTSKAICAYAASVGSVLAIECAGPCFVRDHDMWIEMADRVGSDALKVNYDPANIVWAGKDPVEGVRKIGAHIVHTHAKDIGRVLDAAGRDMESLLEDEHLQDVPAGEGLVGYPAYLAALKKTGFDGYLTIEMHPRFENGQPVQRPADIAKAAANLRGMLEAL